MSVQEQLGKYREKRRFEETPEPSGEETASPGSALRFVVQKHAASHLHYDFRLELDGVLKSWAVPKGPSLNPEDKRLAMHVEDHPLAYMDFEGIIPEGNYGAGTVMVWDAGTYYADSQADRRENQRLIREGLASGKLTLTLEGSKLHGEFALVKMKGRRKGDKDNQWLLIKHEDDEARREDVTEQRTSIRTGRTLEEIADEKTRLWTREGEVAPEPAVMNSEAIREILAELDDALKAPVPHDVRPMLATLVDDPFDRENWVFEIKWDGYRAVAETGGRLPRLYSRNLKPFDQKFPLVFQALKKIPYAAVFDGELVGLDEAGRDRFDIIKNYERNQNAIFYYVFDLLWLEGYDLRRLPLRQRKAILRKILPDLPRLRYCDHVEHDGERFFAAAEASGLEGMIAKDAEAPYITDKRTRYWLKVKTHKRQEAVIAGFTEPRGSRKDIGALILGVYEDDELVYIGHTGTGMDERTLRDLHEKLVSLTRKTTPFKTRPKTNETPTWVTPKLVCEIRFQEWTPDGKMRHPVFIGLREDKSPQEVVRETEENTGRAIAEEAGEKATEMTTDKPSSQEPEKKKNLRYFSPEEPGKSGDAVLRINDHDVPVTNLRKTYFPALHLKKKDLIAYYRDVAPVLLPYLKDRPFVLHRHPDGVEGESFYQKDNPGPLPDWVETVDIHSESAGRTTHYILCQNEETLVYLANLGCIELNPWNARIRNLDNPDYMVIDLDPVNVPFDRIVETAHVVRRVLEDAGAECYCKTSGKKGLHIYVPVGGRYSDEVVREFGHLVALMAHHRFPQWTSVERMPKQRQGKVYLDYLQNRHGQTLVAPYSVRPVNEATVSTPLIWDEVKKGFSPKPFSLETVPRRVRDLGDLWGGVLGEGVDLLACLERLQ